MKKVKTFDDILNCNKLYYYEVHHFNRQTNNLIEVKDIKGFIEAELYNQQHGIKSNCLDINYINHHNFHYE